MPLSLKPISQTQISFTDLNGLIDCKLHIPFIDVTKAINEQQNAYADRASHPDGPPKHITLFGKTITIGPAKNPPADIHYYTDNTLASHFSFGETLYLLG